MKRNSLKETFSESLNITFYILIVFMALCTGLYMRQLFLKEEVLYFKETHTAEKTRETLPVETLRKESEENLPETLDPHSSIDLNDILDNAVNTGGQLLDNIVTSLTESEFGLEVFDEEERQNIQDLSDFVLDLIGYDKDQNN